MKRVVRALEYQHFTGRKFSEYNEEQRQRTAEYDFCYFVLNDERAHLYERINKRVDIMVEDGLLKEVTALKEKGYSDDLVSMQGVGYKEIIEYLNDNISFEESVELIKKNTRHFAKRQLTWFRKEEEVIWINKPDFDYDDTKILEYMKGCMHERNKYMVDKSDLILAVWNGNKKGGTWDTIKYALKKKKKIIYIRLDQDITFAPDQILVDYVKAIQSRLP